MPHLTKNRPTGLSSIFMAAFRSVTGSVSLVCFDMPAGSNWSQIP
jgi:hypothetical protein